MHTAELAPAATIIECALCTVQEYYDRSIHTHTCLCSEVMSESERATYYDVSSSQPELPVSAPRPLFNAFCSAGVGV